MSDDPTPGAARDRSTRARATRERPQREHPPRDETRPRPRRRTLAAALATLAVTAASLGLAATPAQAAGPTPIAQYPLNATTLLTDTTGTKSITASGSTNATWKADHVDLTATNSYIADNAFTGFTLVGRDAVSFAVDAYLPTRASGTAADTLLTYGGSTTATNLSVLPFYTATTSAVQIKVNNTAVTTVPFPALAKGVWQNVAVSFSSRGTLEVFVDGVSRGAAATTAAVADIGNGVFRLNRNATTFTNVPSAYRDLGVYGQTLTETDARALATANAQWSLEQALATAVPSSDPVTTDLVLPQLPGLSWSSSDPAIIAADGNVTRPSAAAGDASVTLTLAQQRAGATFQASKTLTVKAVEVYDSVPVGQPWSDTSGDLIQAHGGGFLEHDGAYYWVGEDKSHNGANFNGVNLYRSTDLVNWDFVKQILTPEAAGLDCGVRGTPLCKVERPKLLYNASNDTFVLWGHWEDNLGYTKSELVVAVSDAGVDGDYAVQWHERPGTTQRSSTNTVLGASGYLSRDFTAYVDAQGDAYVISAQGSGDTRVYPLGDDFATLDIDASYPIDGFHREAPAVAYIDGFYYLLTSSQSGWYANQTVYIYTDDLAANTWSTTHVIGNNTSFKSQPTSIMTIGSAETGYSYIYLGDRWEPSKLGSSTYIWLPMELGATRPDGSRELSMAYTSDWSFDVGTGEVRNPELDLVSQGKPASSTGGGALSPGYTAAGYAGPVPSPAAGAANDGVEYNLATSGSDTHFFNPAITGAVSVAGGGSILYDWQVDLGAVRDLSRVDIGWRNWNGSEPYSQYKLYGSVDGSTWSVIEDASANRTVSFTSDAVAGSFRHVRLEVLRVANDHNGNAASWAAGLVEVQVYAAKVAALDVRVTAATRCIAGKVTLTVQAGNADAVPVALDVVTASGSKAFAAVAPGKNASAAFSTRAASLAAGSVTVTATATVGGVPVTTPVSAQYPAVACG